MSSDVVIRVENLGKRYILAHQQKVGRSGYRRFSDVVLDAVKSPARRLRALRAGIRDANAAKSEEFWALKDVSLEVRRGEVLGIVGHNGAGKSTMLKVLSRITEPTTGRIEIDGRVGSLLEVGTGFHPELTGRENIFLNGAILGMSRAEIKRKFDEIVAFAETERFLDTPVKHYSSGMYVRLAFAVAGHLEPDVLIVDEVLAVGDAEFQKKCLGKMQDVANKDGRTVLFVSHNMGVVAKLCSKVVVMHRGQVKAQGNPSAMILEYLNASISHGQNGQQINAKAPAHPFVLRSAEVLNKDLLAAYSIPDNEPFYLRLRYELQAPIPRLRIGFRLHSYDGTTILTSTHVDEFGSDIPTAATGSHVAVAKFPAMLFNRGKYYISVGADIPGVCVVLSAIEQIANFSIEPIGGVATDGGRLGVIAPLLEWQNSHDKS